MKKVIELFESVERFFAVCWQLFKLLMDLNYGFIISGYDFACSINDLAAKIRAFPFYVYSVVIAFPKEAYLFLLDSFTGFLANIHKSIDIIRKLAIEKDFQDFSEFSNDFITLFKTNFKILLVMMITAATCYKVYQIFNYLYIRFERIREIMNDMVEEQRLRNEIQIEPPRTRRPRQRRQRQTNVEPSQPEAQSSHQSDEQHTSQQEEASISPIKGTYLCCVCMENNCEIVLMPCKHLCFCDSCYRQSRAQAQMKVCPICRQLVKKEIKIFA